MSDKFIINKKYKEKEPKGNGAYSNVYSVEEIKTKKIYAAKIFKSHNISFNTEVEILETLKQKNLTNIVNIIDNGDADIIKGYSVYKKQYIILEYFKKGNLDQYITIPNKSFKIDHAKLLFKKIVNAVYSIHKNGICHRDLKLNNILLNDKFNPKICDFGFSTYNQKNLNEKIGTPRYFAPEIHEHKKYDGIKVDIFALGIVLFELVTNKRAFTEAKKTNHFYKYIYNKDYNTFWKNLQIEGLSDEFKKLYISMVSYNAKERPYLDEILENEWLKLDSKEIDNIESDLYEDFLEREKIVKESKNKMIVVENDFDESEISYDYYGDTKGSGEDIKNYFDNKLLPRQFIKGKCLEFYVKIQGNLNPVKFMNNLTKKLEQEKNEYSCTIEVNEQEYKLKFIALFNKIEEEEKEEKNNQDNSEEDEEEEENNEDNLEDKKGNYFIRDSDIKIKIELFESCPKEYLLRYKKVSGEKDDFYTIFLKINNYVEDIIKKYKNNI